MADEQQYRQVYKNLLFPEIFKTFSIAIQPAKIIVAFLAVTLICLAGWIMDFSATVVTTPDTGGKVTELQVYLTNPDQLQSYIDRYAGETEPAGVFATIWNFAGEKFAQVLSSLFAMNFSGVAANIAEYFKATGWLFRYHPLYSFIFVAINLVIIAVAGGSLCRMAALQFTRGEKPGFTEAIGFGMKKFTSFLTAPLIPLAVIACIGLLIFSLGLLTNIPYIGELILGVSIPFALIAGTLITILSIGLIVGFNLMFPAIAYENSDCFDAVSRSLNYIFIKPWQMGLYTALAAVYGAICYLFLRFFAFLILFTTNKFLQLGIWANSAGSEINKLKAIWPEPAFNQLLGTPALNQLNWSESASSFLLRLSLLVVLGLVVAFIISFYFSANTIIYALLRKKVDDTPLIAINAHPEDFNNSEPGPQPQPQSSELPTDEPTSPDSD